jgi:ribonuclease BN (tRNA processing enzyme)
VADMMKLILYGIMGSLPGGNSDLGKNTTSLAILDGANTLLIDAGSGITTYFNETNNQQHHILFTHYHLDHVIGLPFIDALFDELQTIHLYGPNLNGFSPKHILPSLLKEPFLPIELHSFKATLTTHPITPKKAYSINGFIVTALNVPHPGGCYVYSITKANKKVCILTDLPHQVSLDNDLIQFCKNADLIYYDGYFLDKELYPKMKTYGHSTVENASLLLRRSNAKKCIIGHHQNTRQLEDLKQYESDSVIIGLENNSINV